MLGFDAPAYGFQTRSLYFIYLFYFLFLFYWVGEGVRLSLTADIRHLLMFVRDLPL